MSIDDMDEEVRNIGDRIVCLSLKKSVALSDYLKRVYGLEAVITSKPSEKLNYFPEDFYFRDFDVVLENFGHHKIEVIKVIRALTGLGLKDAKDAIENTPFIVRKNISKEEAKIIKEQLENVGAIVTVMAGL